MVPDKLAQVNNHLKILEGAKSPKVVDLDSVTEKDSPYKKKSSPVEGTPYPSKLQSDDDEDDYAILQRGNNQGKRYLNFDDVSDGEENTNKPGFSGSINTSKRQKSQTKSSNVGLNNKTSRNIDDETSVLSPTETDGKRTPNASDGEREDNPRNKPDEKVITLADIMAEIKSNKSAIENLQREVRGIKEGTANDPPSHRRPTYDQKSKSGSTYKNARDLEDGEFIEGNVELGPPGTGIVVTDMEWTAAISRGSYKAMATSLVTSLFPTDVLLRSNYKAGESKFKKKDDPSPKYDALDPTILRAVLYSVRRTFPKTYTETGVGQAINVKLTNLRAKASAEQKKGEPSK